MAESTGSYFISIGFGGLLHSTWFVLQFGQHSLFTWVKEQIKTIMRSLTKTYVMTIGGQIFCTFRIFIRIREISPQR